LIFFGIKRAILNLQGCKHNINLLARDLILTLNTESNPYLFNQINALFRQSLTNNNNTNLLTEAYDDSNTSEIHRNK
jgi:hypothetical protein